ncbi:hypothetical protein [Paracidovorax cattleyae]|uniref:hypothetical protein n=1 Tax=Paracidovorax cattleyae TaxID=80868 RepID=UPI001E4E778E|nr:hypothetical protein [Paracidovorax cattleyae]
MNILIFHSIPYPHVEYHRGIDHSRHDVTYFGPAESLDTVPEGLCCRKVVRPCAAGACEEARAWMAAHPSAVFDRVIALSEGERLEAARLREWLGLPGDRSEKVAALRNKLWMKQAVAAAGLRVPRFASLPAFLARRDGLSWQGRTVLKPHSGAASEDVAVFASAAARAPPCWDSVPAFPGWTPCRPWTPAATSRWRSTWKAPSSTSMAWSPAGQSSHSPPAAT